MSNQKSILILSFLIAALSVFLVFPFSSAKRTGTTASFSLLDATGDYRRIEISKSGAEGFALERETHWKLMRPYVGEADNQKVTHLLDKLMFTPVDDVISDSKMLKLGRSYADFSLTEPILRVSVSDRTGVTTDISFGARTPTADGIYATVAGRSVVFVVPTGIVSLLDVPMTSFYSRRLLTASVESVESIDVKIGAGTAKSFVRTEGGWRSNEGLVSGRAVDQYVAETFSASAADLVRSTADSNGSERVSSSVLAGYGLDSESAVTVIFKRNDVKERLLFGKPAEQGLVYALIQNGSVIATVPVSLRDKAVRASSLFLDSRLFPDVEKTARFVMLCDGDTVYSLIRDETVTWRLETPISALADKKRTEDLLHRILSLTTADVCASNAPDAVSVTLSTNSAPIVVSRGRLMSGCRYEDLRSREVVCLEASRIRRLVRIPGGGKTVLPSTAVALAGDHGTWSVESAGESDRPDEKAIANVLEALNPLVADRVEKMKVPAAALDDYGLDRPFLTLAIDLKDEAAVRRNILIGKKTSGGRYLTVGSSDAVFVVSEDLVEKLSAPLVRN